MGPVWEYLASDSFPTSQAMDDQVVKPTPRVPSLFRTLANRQIRPSKVCQLPYEGEWTSGGGEKGGGILTVKNQSYRAPPLSLSFAKKRLNGQMLAVADEEGYVSIFNTDGQLPSMADCYVNTRDVRSKHWEAHTNAVFDVCWTKDDTHILTASGDQTIRLWDIENKRGVGVMMGHTGSVKSISVHPSHTDLFVSGSRDGCVSFWDLRAQSGLYGCGPRYTPVTKIKDAHKGVMNARRRKGYTRSVTSVLYLKEDRLIATGGANDGVVKFWDTRKLKSPVAHTPSERVSSRSRMHGVAGLSQDLTGTRLIATCVDSKIYMYDVLALAKGELKTFSGHTMGSFYIKASFSPDGSHILGGSTDHNAYLWKVDGPENPPTPLRGHSGEVTAVDWCPMDHCKVATCSDDFTVRVWKLKTPRFCERPPPKPSRSPFRCVDVETRARKYSFVNLRIEDSQHRLPAEFLQREKKLEEAHIDTDFNTLKLVEDSQHPLSTSQLEDFGTNENTSTDASPHSSETESSSGHEKLDEVSCPHEGAALLLAFNKGVHGGSGITLHPKRTRVLFRGGDELHNGVFQYIDEHSGRDCPRKENLENSSGLWGGLGEKQVSPSFKRTRRIPFKERNSDDAEIRGTQTSTAAAEHLAEDLPDDTTTCSKLKKLVAEDKQSTPLFQRSRMHCNYPTVADSECQVQKAEHDSSPLGHCDGSPSSVLSPPNSTQRRRKTIMDYFGLQPHSTVACEKTSRKSV